jgi:hypothetical protein
MSYQESGVTYAESGVIWQKIILHCLCKNFLLSERQSNNSCDLNLPSQTNKITNVVTKILIFSSNL